MAFKAAIFDLDGTLLDSMGIWSNLCYQFLQRHGITLEAGGLAGMEKKLEVLSIRNALEYVLKVFPQINIDLDSAHQQTWQIVENFYRHQAEIKPGIPEIIAELESKNIPAGIITATESELVNAALQKVGLDGFFCDRVMSCATLQMSKRSPEVFMMMAEKLNAAPSEIIVFEDALYAASTAKAAGFAVAAVYDPSEKNPEKLAEIADWYCRSWEELPLDIL
ncbi:MAG: HAD family phosphatase [Lentisphaerae bacterium]|nr:HAD family phosphatase [Lentisphaerota bacterium]